MVGVIDNNKNSSHIINQKSEEIQNKQSSVRSVDSSKASIHHKHHHHQHHHTSHPPLLFANDKMKRKRCPAPIIKIKPAFVTPTSPSVSSDGENNFMDNSASKNILDEKN
jgi:hypothetical protein